MEVNNISTLSGLSNSAFQETLTGKGSEELGRNQFLKLMLAQMENQDPLSPSENEDFVAQLAQFSSLEGIENLNTSIESLAGDFRATMTLQATSLVGRSVLVPTNQTLMSGNGLMGDLNIPSTATEVSVEISDARGLPVTSLSFGSQTAGAMRFSWDGRDAQGQAMDPGIYRVHAFAAINGESQPLTVDLPEQVVSVSLDPNGIKLNLSGGSTVGLNEVKEIQ